MRDGRVRPVPVHRTRGAFLIAGYRGVRYGRGRRKPTEIPLIVIAVALGLAFVFLAPAIQVLESALAPSLGRLLSNACTLIAAFGLLHLMLYVSHPPEQVPTKVRTRLITLLTAIGVMTVTFSASSPPTGTGIFTGLYRSQPTLAVYTLVYASYLGSAVVDLAALALRSIRGARAWLRLGMILTATGCMAAAGYLIEKVIGVLSQELLTASTAEPYCPSAFATLGCTFAVGMPALAVLLHHPWHHPAHHRAVAGTPHSWPLEPARSAAAATTVGDLARGSTRHRARHA